EPSLAVMLGDVEERRQLPAMTVGRGCWHTAQRRRFEGSEHRRRVDHERFCSGGCVAPLRRRQKFSGGKPLETFFAPRIGSAVLTAGRETKDVEGIVRQARPPMALHAAILQKREKPSFLSIRERGEVSVGITIERIRLHA